jgi:molybdenum cofactor cytidylyltransferase
VLTGDKGAKPVMNANTTKVIEVTVDDPGVLKDVDTPEDL